MPCEALLKKGPLAFAYEVLPHVLEKHNATGKHPTAVGVLKFFLRMNVVFIQDAAATLILHANRWEHPVLNELAFSESPEFEVRSTFVTSCAIFQN
jgi:hypothetical protein